MASRRTYTTGSRSAELDRAFEAALADARARDAEALAHLVGGHDVLGGDVFERKDPSRHDHVASRAHEGSPGAWPGIQSFCGWKSSGLTGKGGLGPYYVQQFAREQSRTIVES